MKDNPILNPIYKHRLRENTEFSTSGVCCQVLPAQMSPVTAVVIKQFTAHVVIVQKLN